MGYLGNPMYGQNKHDRQADGRLGAVEHLKPASDGTVASPSKTLTASDAGNYYIVDISANTAAFVLPDAAVSRGAIFTFIMSIESDAEATKDFILATAAATTYLMGAGIDGGGVHDQPSDDDFIQLDSSDGAIGAGDRVQVICDGSHWYVLEATALTAGAWNTGTASRS